MKNKEKEFNDQVLVISLLLGLLLIVFSINGLFIIDSEGYKESQSGEDSMRDLSKKPRKIREEIVEELEEEGIGLVDYNVDKRLASIAEEDLSVELCKEIEDEARKSNCVLEVTRKKAIEEKDISVCNKSTNKYSCMGMYFQERAKEEGSLEFLSNDVKDKKLRNRIHDLLLVREFRERVKENCSVLKLKKNEIKCKNHMLYEKAMKKLDKSYCKKISKKPEESYCIDKIDIYKESLPNSFPEKCLERNYKPLKAECIQKEIAFGNASVERCNLIDWDEKIKEKCKELTPKNQIYPIPGKLKRPGPESS